MKKVLAVLLTLAMVFAFCACKKDPEYKFGMGLATSVSATSATAENNGKAEVDVYYATILVDSEGKIAQCYLDCAQESLAINAEGEILDLTEDFKTKNEKKEDYGMKKASAIGKEWYEQAAHLAEKLVGLKQGEVAAYVAADESGKSTNADVLAGCTMGHMEYFIQAVENAFENLEDAGTVTSMAFGIETTISGSMGASLEFDIYAAGKALDTDSKLAAIQIDCSQIKFTLDEIGTVTAPTELRSKVQKKDDYGMKKASAIGKEWYEQAEFLGEQLEGKTVSEIKAFGVSDEGYATDTDVLAGCSMGHINVMIEAVCNGIE